jgi:fructoselysine 6-kinase
MPETKYATVGDNCIDWFVPPLDECFVGGNAVNVAVQLAMLGASVRYFGAVGDDRAGRAVKETLDAMKVDVSNVMAMRGQKTAYTTIEISNDGDRTFTFEEFGACALYRASPGDILKLRTVRHVHIGWLNDGGNLKKSLAGSGVTISQDLGVNNEAVNLSPEGLDIAFAASDPQSGEARIRELLAGGARVAVVTLGAAGSIVGTGNSRLTAAAMPILPEDTTGAGDAYFAGFIHAFAESADLKTCMERGLERAAKACMYRGGFPQQPLKGLLEL